MKREFLKGLELSDEVIDKIMAENGKDVEANKQLSATITDLKDQLGKANEQITAFKDLDIEGVKQAAADWEQKAKDAEKKADEKISSMKFEFALSNALTAAKAKNAKAVRALLDTEVLKLDGDAVKGLDEQIEKLKKENDYLFESEPAGKPSFSGKQKADPGSSGGKQENNFVDAFRQAAGLKGLKGE